MAEAQEEWGDDGNQPAHYDSDAEAQEEGWADDTEQPIKEEPAMDETPTEEAPADAADAADATDAAEEDTTQAASELDNEEGQVTEEKKRRDASG